jgi:signal peptidase I
MSETGQQPPESRPHREGIKETIESIVIALILAFVFRAFVVEAFVIPTGSMAPTLYGAHGTILCADCGTEFAYGLRDLEDKRGGSDIKSSAAAICPNCHHANTDLAVSDERRNPEKGDRILVLKWPFDIGGSWLDPARWDVIVFKDPADGTTNFIKRLAGLPNEVLMILDGDVYTVPVSELAPDTLSELDRYRHEKHEFTDIKRQGQLQPISAVALSELDEKLRIARKTRTAQEPLWHTVYDHDFPPRKLDSNQPRWAANLGADSGWDASLRRVRFVDKNQVGDSLELSREDFRAGCAYNITARTAPAVSDQRVRFVLTPEQTAGRVMVRLSKWSRSFWASIGMDGAVALYEGNDIPGATTKPMITAQVPPVAAGESIEVGVENLDYRLALSVRGEEVLTSSSDLTSPAYYGPNVRSLRQMRKEPHAVPPRVFAEGGNFELTHLAVDRDEYYYTELNQSAFQDPRMSWAPHGGWASPNHPILLRHDEFFMLGDNTAASKDSRLWDVRGQHLVERGEAFQLGTVPRDQLIGKAFFVYWPSGHRIDWLPLLGKFGVVPDVGRMRWIR